MSSPDKTVGRFTAIQNADNNNEGNSTKVVDVASSLYEFVGPTGTKWNQLFPYQLVVVKKVKSGWERSDEKLQFTLPIAPQALEIDMPFAITTSATLGGIVEEQNGAPFRMINFSGTTGVLPLKGAPDTVAAFNLAEGIFAGTIAASSVLATDLTRSGIISDKSSNVVPNNEFTDNAAKSSINKTSGYYQWHQLRQFFEVYAQLKKTVKGRDLRLAFAMWKDESIYLVTPMQFRTSRDAGSPYEYRYNISLKAWARIKLAATFKADVHAPHGRDPNLLAKMLTTLRGVREALENSKKIIQAVRGDVNNALFTPLREIMLAAKGVAGVAIALSDLPANIVTDSKESVAQITSDANAIRTVPNQIKSKIQSLGNLANKTNVRGGRIVTTQDALTGADPANKIFDNPDDNFAAFSQIDPSRVKLPLNVQRKIQDEKRRVTAFTRKDFEIRRDSIVSVMVDFAEAVGLGSETFNRIYGIHPRTTSLTKIATEDDFDIVFNLNNLVIELNRLCVSNKIDPNQADAIEYIAGLARQSSIAFTEPRSKFLVPFLVGHSLEEMAKRYLGDANRWHEIAALNGLREPYIDEVGFDVALSTNGGTNKVQVADTTNLFVGQYVYISSSTVKQERRRITGIQKITTGIYFVSLSGEADLERFTVSSEAKLHAYLPDTINSQMSIYIPSQDDPHLEDFLVKTIQGIDYFDNLIRVGGISLLLTSSNDISLTSDGRSRLAVGLTNIVQKARIALATSRGSLLQHPTYGLPVSVGESTADVSATAVLESIKEMFSKDPSFSDITSAQVIKSGPVSRITVNIGIAGTTQVIPITAEIRR